MFSDIIMYLSLFIISFLSATILPFSPDAVAAYMAVNDFLLIFIVAVATLGSYLGSCTTYYLGYLGREKILKQWLKNKEGKMEKYHQVFVKYGEVVLLFSWIPFIGDIFVGLAGVLKVDFFVFSFFVMFGKILRFFFVVYAADRFL